MSDSLTRLTLTEARQKLRSKEISPLELTTGVLDRIKSLNPKLNAYVSLCEQPALERAKSMSSSLPTGKLAGVPIAVKDIILTCGHKTTACSKILDGFLPPYAAHVVDRLEAEGAIIVGKTNCDEFAMGSSNENSAYGNVRNPWNTDHVPGGSSGGSAAAVSADLCFGALGTDTGGSIRQPASHCSITGIRPTYGRVSRYGVIAFASSLDQVGPMGKSVEDCATLLEVIAGKDGRDSTSLDLKVPDYSQQLGCDPSSLKIGIPKEYLAEADGLHPDIRKAIEASIEFFRSSGATIKEVSLPHTKYGVAVYYVIAPAEASSNLSRYDGVKYGFRDTEAKSLFDMYCRTRSLGFGAEVKRRILLGTFVLSSGYYDAYYRRAQTVRTLIKNDFLKAFEQVDCLLTPTAPTPPFRLGEKTEDPLTMYLSDIFTISANLAGIPGIVVPCGFSQEGLPIGMQLMGNHFSETKLFQIAHTFQTHTDWHSKKPVL